VSRQWAGGGAAGQAMIVGSVVLVFAGLGFKMAMFPFHFWAPTVYQFAPGRAATYIATASKVAAVAILIRVGALAGGGAYFVDVLAVLAIVSMTLGNLSALAQKDLKRLLAYSSIAHAGYVMIGILSTGTAGHSAAAFYALAILVMKFTCFLVVLEVAVDGGNVTIADLAGLHKRAPLLAMALMLALFGLAGIPPTIGFTGKLLLFTAAMEKGLFSLVIIAMVNVVISLYYYLQVLRAAYLVEPAEGALLVVESPRVKALSVALVVVMVGAGIYPRMLIDLFQAAVKLLG